MLIRTCIASGILLALAGLGVAQQKPDFSGEWILNRQASTLSPGAAAVQSGVVRIKHRDPTFRYKAAFVSATVVARWRIQRPDGEMRISFRHELIDGGSRLRAVEQLRGAGQEQDNVWIFDRR